jgi:endonuclease/exonuclease/phosphatase family metal-dependent hydrolase
MNLASWVQRMVFGAATLLAVSRQASLRAELLTIATYNVENYGAANRMTADGFRPDYPKPEAQKKALREVIRSLGADVLVLQEMGPQPYLAELQRDLAAEGCHFPYVALATAADAERHVAVLSRRRLQQAVTMDLQFRYFGERERVKRGLLHAVLDTDAGALDLFAVHLKSRLTERADDPLCTTRRAAEATAIRDAILQRFPTPSKGRFIVLGDCNDAKSSRAVRRLQHRGATEVAVLVPAVDRHGETWTYFFGRDDTYSRVDYVFVSPGLVESVVGRSGRIADGEAVAAASDHRPVVVQLRLEP